MFDNVCKFLAETFPTDLASWLLGEAIPLSQLSPSELSLEPIRADSLLLLQSAQTVMHVEFQTQPDPDMGFRLLDYRLRIYRRFPHKAMRQFVIYLRPTNSPLVQQTSFEIPGTRHEFEVIRLWEQPLSLFLNAPGLLPFAPLSQTPNRAETLRQVASMIKTIPDRRIQNNIAASTGILAGLVLEEGLVRQILRGEVMKESVVYQGIKAEGIEEGLKQGRQEGECALIVRLLTFKFGSLSPASQRQIEGLAVPQLEALGESLLAFETVTDLDAWLAEHGY